ncbi:sigma-70 family RNA polymerase sigma factor [Streptomyces sp. NPDC057280]|uniref:sigma-70 family RNA polymerase sigma factor n=1 Tax=Streptomyces sp. NPDC057280 TaxID=3346081 RepID=UPI00364461DF
MTSSDSGAAPPDRTTRDLDDAVSVFLQQRGRLFGIAYRVLGSVTEAEDVVQEVWLRWQKTDRSVVDNPVGFLSTTTTRLAINVAHSARVRRESYIGPWLPEPVDTSADPEVGAERAEALELALLLVLERLNPTERAAYVLREAFDYGYPEIAAMLRLSLANVRKIVSRARRHVLDETRAPVDTAEHRRLLNAFVTAARTGDVASLEALLTPDAVSLSDGNGVRGCARVPVLSAAGVARLSSHRSGWRDTETEAVAANGRPGVLISREGRPFAFLTVVASQEGIHQVLWVFNPDKIAAFLGSRSRGAAALG